MVKHSHTEQQIDSLRSAYSISELIVDVYRFMGVDLGDNTIGEGDIDPAAYVISDAQSREFAQICADRWGKLAVFQWMRSGPSGETI